MKNNSNIIVALDFNEKSKALSFCNKINPKLVKVKVGKELFVSCGTDIIKEIHKLGFDIFLDLKFHDIPNTVSNAVKAAADLGIWMCNVHALSGKAALEASIKALETYKKDAPLLIAVTLLTSMNQEELNNLKIPFKVNEYVGILSTLAYESKFNGVVCSPHESQYIKNITNDKFITVTPGIRLEKNDITNDDQNRIKTPLQAKKNGADYLVIGRPITQSINPQKTIENIILSLNDE